ncbi:MAG: hypothetical protein P8164_14750 [Gammaproteobacteria bacterium]
MILALLLRQSKVTAADSNPGGGSGWRSTSGGEKHDRRWAAVAGRVAEAGHAADAAEQFQVSADR